MRLKILAVAGFVSLLSIFTSCQASSSLSEVSNHLGAGDRANISGKLYDEYTFEGNAEQSVTIELRSDEFDAYLLLLDEARQTIAENDDMEGYNSAITTNLPSDGTYRVIVTTLEEYSVEGQYVLASSVPLAQAENLFQPSNDEVATNSLFGTQLDRKYQIRAGIIIFFLGVGTAVALVVLKTLLEIYKIRATAPNKLVFSYKDSEQTLEVYTVDHQKTQKIKVGK